MLWHTQAQQVSRGFSWTTRIFHIGNDLRDPPLYQSHHTDEETEEREVKELQVLGDPHWGLLVLEEEKAESLPEPSGPTLHVWSGKRELGRPLSTSFFVSQSDTSPFITHPDREKQPWLWPLTLQGDRIQMTVALCCYWCALRTWG